MYTMRISPKVLLFPAHVPEFAEAVYDAMAGRGAMALVVDPNIPPDSVVIEDENGNVVQMVGAPPMTSRRLTGVLRTTLG